VDDPSQDSDDDPQQDLLDSGTEEEEEEEKEEHRSVRDSLGAELGRVVQSTERAQLSAASSERSV